MPTVRSNSGNREPGSTNSKRLYLGLIAVFFIGTFSLYGYWLSQSRAQLMLKAETDANNLAWVLEDHLETTLRRVDADLAQIAGRAVEERINLRQNEGRRPGWTNFLASLRVKLPEVSVYAFFGPSGDLLCASDSKISPFNVADRQHFKTSRDSTSEGLVFSDVIISRSKEEQSISVARGVRDERGNFLGMAAALLDIDYLQEALGAIDLGPNGLVAVRRSDNQKLVIRHPIRTDEINKPVSSPITRRVTGGERVGIDRFASPVDRIDRIWSFRQLNDYPLHISVAIAEKDVLAPWNTQAFMATVMLGSALLALAALLWRLWQTENRRSELIQTLLQSEQHLEQERVRLQTILQTSSDGIHILDEDGLLVEANPAFLELVGFEPADIGKARVENWNIRHAWENTREDRIELVRTRGKVLLETRYRRRDGRELDVEIHVSGVEMDGKPYLYVASRDITERKRGEAKLRRALQAAEAASVAKSRFLATMSHEIRTPMNGILGMAQMLTMPKLDDAERLDYAHTIISSGETLLALLNDILDLSKIEAGKIELEMKPVDPEQIIQETLTLFSSSAQAKGLSLEGAWLGERQHRFEADPLRVRQMLSNLVGNAIKFTEHGSVSIEVQQLTAENGEALLQFVVTDTGIGIELEKQIQLFSPFSQADNSFTRKYGGTGLGLSIVKNLARMMGGEVGVVSEPGNGSRFWFNIRARILPLDPPQSLAPSPATQETAGAKTSFDCTVLIVEDNATNQKVVSALLGALGVRILVAENGQQGLDKAKTEPAIDLILMDVNMPVMDGFEAVKRIREWEAASGAPRRPVIALTADAFEEDRERCLAAGMDDHLSKPVGLKALRDALGKHLPQKRNA